MICFAANNTNRIVSPAQFYNVHRINADQFEVLHLPNHHSKIIHQSGRQVHAKFTIILIEGYIFMLHWIIPSKNVILTISLFEWNSPWRSRPLKITFPDVLRARSFSSRCTSIQVSKIGLGQKRVLVASSTGIFQIFIALVLKVVLNH